MAPARFEGESSEWDRNPCSPSMPLPVCHTSAAREMGRRREQPRDARPWVEYTKRTAGTLELSGAAANWAFSLSDCRGIGWALSETIAFTGAFPYGSSPPAGLLPMRRFSFVRAGAARQAGQLLLRRPLCTAAPQAGSNALRNAVAAAGVAVGIGCGVLAWRQQLATGEGLC